FPSPASTCVTFSLSAFGCCTASMIWATTILSEATPFTSMPSTSTPAKVSKRSNSSGVLPFRSTCVASQFSETFIAKKFPCIPCGPWCLSSELLQEARVVLDQEADILDAPADHREAVEAHAEGEAGDLFRI